MALEHVCSELKRYGIKIDAEALRRAYPDDDQLAQVERNLWQMLRNAEEARSRTDAIALLLDRTE